MMGRSKFPGKPSKSVMKERIRVLNKDESEKAEKNSSWNTNRKIICRNFNSVNDSSINWKGRKLDGKTVNGDIGGCQSDPIDSRSKTNSGEIGLDQKLCADDILEGLPEKNLSYEGYSSGGLNLNENGTGNTNCSLTELEKNIKKKTVTFKNILETSDDASTIKKIHNPLNKGPLVSIMKKECHTSQSYMARGDGIVRPSRLTEILKNNGNIDKTKSLSFRSVQSPSDISDSTSGKKIKATQSNEHHSNVRDASPVSFLDTEIKRCDQTNEDNYSQLLYKWKLYKLSPKSRNFKSPDLGDEIYQSSLKRKEPTVQNKIILREPRLHFQPKTEEVAKGKQSGSEISNNVLSTTVCSHSVCGVCNTFVNNKHVQNRKYGVLACDACRKFISKITKKTVSSSTNSMAVLKIQCSKRDGECAISSLPKNNVKSFKKIFDERCSACWLKKCIQAFHFPSGHKLRLNAILSETHKSKINVKLVNASNDPLCALSAKSNELINDNCHTKSQINTVTWGMNEPPKYLEKNGCVNSTTDQFSDNDLTLKCIPKVKDSPCIRPVCTDLYSVGKNTRFYSEALLKKNSENIIWTDVEQTNDIIPEYPKRQKIDFKGPRVKHVCRSASIALGQQIATFSNEDVETSKQLQSDSKANSLLGNLYLSGNEQQNYSHKAVDDSKDIRMQFEEGGQILQQGLVLSTGKVKMQPSLNIFENTEKNELDSTKDKKTILFEKAVAYDKNNFQFPKSAQKYSENKNVLLLTHRKLSTLSKRNIMRISKARNHEQKPKIISVDFWDTFVPAEVNQTGFGLILTEPVSICAICFLCGSMDLDNLLFCASCCEPYHSYCIAEENSLNSSIFQDKNAPSIENRIDILNQLNWVCPRCTVCYTCNMSSGAKVKCQKCKKYYHSTCMGTSKGLLGADRPLICGSCLKCQACLTTKVSKYIGNQPFCIQCFKLKKSGVRCPLCSNNFDNILDLIILECGICEKLIHAKCEGLTEEQSNLLSNLPGYIKFICKKCSSANENAESLAKEWRKAVYEELKTGLLDILKLLSRSRQANVLKRYTKNTCLCSFDKTNNNYHINDITKSDSQTSEASCSILKSITGSALYPECIRSNTNLQQLEPNNMLSLVDIKKKIINGEYVSLFDFNADMNDVIMPLKNDELILAYKEIISEKFSWFQNETKTCTDALEEDMFESCNYSFQLDELIVDDVNTATKLPQFAGKVFNSIKQQADKRVCILCLKEGDGGLLQESRLLYYGCNSWIHANCAIWSNDVYEEFDGTLQNVHNALHRGRLTKCVLCNWSGATVKCVARTCSNYYHFHCARKAECIFKSDKSVYCSAHCAEEKTNSTSTNETFSVLRPLYIEFDRSRRKLVEPSKVQFMVGSLSVIQLGSVYSKFSDTSEAIVPINFVCTRLYWSCKEPWKIVKYSVRTLIQHNSVTITNDMGKNFTVDHSKNINIVENDLSRIARWHSTLARDDTLDVLHYECGQFGNLQFSTGSELQNEASDSCVEEEPQNNSDLLPPEIKDAIFEDLPHDILDGISMLDIFPKLMIYEDLIAIEGKSDNSLLNEVADNNGALKSEDFSQLHSLNKQEINSKFRSNVKSHLEETNHHTVHTFYPKRELYRSNSEVFLRNFDGFRSQQRSSSVTWGCKFDNTKRYFRKGLSDVGLSETRVFNPNYSSLENECEDYKINFPKKNRYEKNLHLKKEKLKLMQLDGTDDAIMGYLSSQMQNSTTKIPVKCDRCQCTYRTFESLQRHLINCEQISTSESETETSNPDTLRPKLVFQEDCVKNNLQLYQNRMENDHKMQRNISIVNEPNVISSKNIIPQNIYVTNAVDYEDNFFLNINESVNTDKDSIQSCYDENNWCNVGDSCNSIRRKDRNNYDFTNSNNKTEQCNIFTKIKPEAIVAPDILNTANNKTEYNHQDKHNYLQFLNQNLALNNQYSQKEQQSQQQQYVVIQQSVGNSQPLFIQQMSSPATIPQNIFPVVLSNNSMQYTSIPSQANPLVPGILQSDATGNVILSSGLQMLSMPSLQITSQSSPQLLGTFNQTQPLQLGSNPMIIGGTTTMELMPNTNQVVLATPPVYYGLETIVQNTVMSSQQFVSTAMQGVLSQNASFSATTTQVFQSSKFEPVTDVPGGYVVLNNMDGSALVVPQTNLLSGFLNNSAHEFQNNYTQDFGNMSGTHTQAFIQQSQPSNVMPLIPPLSDITCIPVETPANRTHTTMNLESHSLDISLGKQSGNPTTASYVNVSSNNVATTSSRNLLQSSPVCNVKKYNVEDISTANTNYGNDFSVQVSKNIEKSTEAINKYSKHKVQIKPKVVSKYIKRIRIPKSTKLIVRNNTQKEGNQNQLKSALPEDLAKKNVCEMNTHLKTTDGEIVEYSSLFNTSYNKQNNNLLPQVKRKEFELSTQIFENDWDSKDSIPRIRNRSVSQLCTTNTTKSALTTTSFGSNSNNVPTNIVAPILQANQSNNTPSRPTNRVLPMQSVHVLDKTKCKSINLKRPSLKDNAAKTFNKICSDVEININPFPVEQDIRKNDDQNLVSDATKESEHMNLDSLLKSNNDMSESAPHVSCPSNRISLEMLPNSEYTSKIKNSNIPHNTSEKDDESKLNLINNAGIDISSLECEEKNHAGQKKSTIKSIEGITNTKLEALYDETSAQDKHLNTVPSTHFTHLKNKSPKKALPDQQFIPNQTVLRFPKNKRLENDDLKKSTEPHLIYEIQSEDGFSYKSNSIADVWEKVFEAVQSARRTHGLASLPIGPFADMCGLQIIGLKTNALKYLIEQLPGTERCSKYTPKYHKNPSVNTNSEYILQDHEELLENISGAMRCEPFTKRSDYDIFSWLASRHRKQPQQIFVQPSETELIARRCTGNLPMAMKYRTLKETCKHNVGVFRSVIHGRGLFCTKDIEAGEMVIEYAGELIRSTVTDKRERFYDGRGIGCYMFKIDDNFVVDATMRGNAARFINHSCEPNCYSKVVDILGHKHIIIFSLRRIVQGEELTYDYKFPFEDVKIPCSCGSKKCRKYLN